MKTKRPFALKWMTAASALSLAIISAQAQTSVLINAFDSADEIADTANGGANPWANWFGTAFYNVTWDASDATNNPNSGSMFMQAYFPDSGIGGCCGPQFLLYDSNDGIQPPLIGNGGPPGAALATNVEFDVRFDPTSFGVTNAGTSTNWPTIEVGTRGIDYGQYTFGTFTIPQSQTNWVHVVIPIAASANWTNIPNIFFKLYTTAFTAPDVAPLGIYFDNIKFTTATVAIVPPTMSLQKPTQALRIFAGSTAQTYDREQVTTVDTNQSWVGGTYPVSYSFKLVDFPVVPTDQNAIFRFHIFLVPMNYAGGNSFANNEYIEYQAGDDLWLNISALTNVGPGNVYAEVAWKTNEPNANPGNIAVSITNSTAIGTWTLTFSNATDGTLTAPGASPAAFSIPADAAARFANPLVAFFGVQPDSGWGEGKYADVAQIQTTGVASPGVAINDDFTTDTSINTNIWDVSNSAQQSSLVLVGSDAAWWVYWTYPDYSSVLATRPDLSGAVPWTSVLYYNNSNTVFQAKMGGNVWSLVPTAGLPTVDGTSHGVKSANAFFRLSNPGPAQ